MKDRDKTRFQSSMTWFNQFFGGLRQIYEHILTLLPLEYLPDGFSANIENYHYPVLKAAPSIPPYYALLLPCRQVALQVISIIDADLIAHSAVFQPEPSMLVVVHSQPEKYAWVDEFAMKIVKSHDLDQVIKENDVIWGKLIGKYPANFFAFQVLYDRFSDSRNLSEVVNLWVIDPLIANLIKNFRLPEKVGA